MGDFSAPVSPHLQEEDTGRGITLQYNGKYLYSKYKPIESTEKTSSSYPTEEETLYILTSPLLGYGLKNFISRIPASSFIVGIELEQPLVQITDRTLKSLNLSPDHFIFSPDPNTLYDKIGEWGLHKFKRSRLLSFNQGFKLNQEGYTQIHSNVISLFHNYRSNRATRVEMGNLWNTNIIRNLHLLSRGAWLNQLQTEKPVFIVGAGESLEKTLPFLKKHGKRFFILCIDTAAPTLTASKIKPDAILNLEGQFYNLYDFYPLKGTKIPIISDILSYPETLHITDGKLYFFSTDFGESTLLDRLTQHAIRPPSIPPLGSVGVAALKIAAMITDSPIIVAGLDFAYIPGKTHTNGSANHIKILSEWNRTNGDPLYPFSIKRGIFPDPVLTAKNPALKSDRSLRNYANQFNKTAHLIKQPLYNLTDGGLKLDIPVITEEKVLALAASIVSTPPQKTPKGSVQKERETSLQSFIEEETINLKKIITLWEQYVLGDSDGKYLKKLLKELKSAPYLYDYFADQLPHPRSEISFLTRALLNAGKFLRLYNINNPNISDDYQIK